MGEILVNLTSLESGQSGIRQNFNRLQTTLQELEKGLQPMIETWTGAAQESYMLCKKQWDTAAAELAQVLNEVGGAVGTAHTNYSEAHTATVRIWS